MKERDWQALPHHQITLYNVRIYFVLLLSPTALIISGHFLYGILVHLSTSFNSFNNTHASRSTHYTFLEVKSGLVVCKWSLKRNALSYTRFKKRKQIKAAFDPVHPLYSFFFFWLFSAWSWKFLNVIKLCMHFEFFMFHLPCML